MKVTDSTKALAEDILDYWDRYPERHDQNSWIDGKAGRLFRNDKVCNTTLCAAGTAVMLSTPTKSEFKEFVKKHETDDMEWTKRAKKLLGLTYDEANKLFYASNESAVDLMRAVAAGDADKFDELGGWDL